MTGWSKDERGTTAIEFAMVAGPFLMFVISIMGYGLYWLATSNVNHAVATASRQIRVGAAQRQNKTVAEFKQMVCDELAASFIPCNTIEVHVQSNDTWAGVTPVNCIQDDGTGLRAPSGQGTDSLTLHSGTESKVVMVTVCHKWDLAGSIPWLMLAAKNSDSSYQLGGSALVQAAAAFRTEPYQ